MYRNFQQINIHQLKEKIGNKKELYDYLTQEYEAYLPKMKCTNFYFFRIFQMVLKKLQILIKLFQYLKRTEVMITIVPQIEGLTAYYFQEYADSKPSLQRYLPNQCDWLHLDKKWIVDLLLTIDQQGRNNMIDTAKLKKRQKLDQSQNMIVHMKPEFARILSSSNNYRGRSTHLMKQSTKRKSKQKNQEEIKQKSSHYSKVQIKILREQLNNERRVYVNERIN